MVSSVFEQLVLLMSADSSLIEVVLGLLSLEIPETVVSHWRNIIKVFVNNNMDNIDISDIFVNYVFQSRRDYQLCMGYISFLIYVIINFYILEFLSSIYWDNYNLR